MNTENGDQVVTYIDKLAIWLGVNVGGGVTEVALTPTEAEALASQLLQQVFRLTGSYAQTARKEE